MWKDEESQMRPTYKPFLGKEDCGEMGDTRLHEVGGRETRFE